MRDCGEERAAPIRERARREERELLVPTPGGLIGAGVWLHGHGERKGRLSFDFALWSADPQKTPVDRYPVVRI